MKYGLYIHLPFCRKKCHYCSFVSITNSETLMESYVDALNSEINLRRTNTFSDNPRTLYIGGGTPSIVSADCIKRIFRTISLKNTVECTVEANPDSLSEQWLNMMLNIGINRISIGIQSLDDAVLCSLGRLHSAKQAVKSVALARKSGVMNLSVDLMFGVPGQTMHIWQETLKEVAGLGVEHISCYSLSIEEDSKYFALAKENSLSLPDSQETTDMYLFAADFLKMGGFLHYEISNFSLPGYECKHNQGYWDLTPYLGVGVSAHSFDGTSRRWNVSDPAEYIRLLGTSIDPIQDFELLDAQKRTLEHLMLSLRVAKGLAIKDIIIDSHIDKCAFMEKIEMMVESGFMEYNSSGNVRLTARGMVIAEEILSEIAADCY
ncbi:MAG: radical SAM family heme chaperone HemW [Candidatus Latescibacterota bacterium]